MTFASLPDWAMNAVESAMLIACAASLLCILRALQQKETRRFALVNLPPFLLCALFTFGTELYFQKIRHEKKLPAIFQPIPRIPVWAIVLLFALSLAIAGAVTVRLTRRLSNTLSVRSVCEGLDKLPEGVAYSAANGVPLLVNAKMHGICTAAIGVGMTDHNYLKRRLENGRLCPGCRLDRSGSTTLLLLPDGSAWDLRERQIRTRFGPVTELLAFDVSPFYRGTEELRRRNERLSAVNERIREYNSRIDKIVREKEILAAKIRLHDDLGRAVLAIRAYLSQPEGNREALLSLLKMPVFLFRYDEEPDTSGDLIATLEQAAAAIGMEIVYEGDLPMRHRDVLAVAIRECITNTAKHANGMRVTVKSRRADGKAIVEITNDGDPPADTVRETGGLKNLRTLSHAKGVEMRVESKPVFRLTLCFNE